MNRLFIVAFVLCLAAVAHAGPKTEKKKLIEFGWDEPSTEFMRQHIGEMEKTPFDGVIFHADWKNPDKKGGGGGGAFMWDCWSRRVFTIEEMQPAIDDLKATQFKKFTHNFLRFNTTPSKDAWSKDDWFDDFTPILSNAKLAGRVAKEGGVKGILFDIEQYVAPIWDYRQQKYTSSKSWDEYAAQVRKRGREVMEAFQDGYPDQTIFLTFGYCLPWSQSGAGKKPLSQVDYGLLAPFCDGLVEGVRGKTILVDGHELSYGYRDVAQFDKAYKAMSQDLMPIVKDPDKYKQVMSLGFGIWMDRKVGDKVTWDESDFSKNYFSPDVFEASVRKALDVSDEYVWIYTETPRWWGDKGPQKLPAAYDAALRRAKEKDPK
jgi:hypothetical protein